MSVQVSTSIDEVTKQQFDMVRPLFEFESMKGEIWLAEDFDALLEDFKEYME